MAISTEQQRALARFGYGPSLASAAPEARVAPGRTLSQPDPVEKRYAQVPLKQRLAVFQDYHAAQAARKQGARDAEARLRDARTAIRATSLADLKVMLLRPMLSAKPLRERLVAFWADHFTVVVNARPLVLLAPDMIETAIRPHITGRFEDMLLAVMRHPAMLLSLNQAMAAGPNSPAAKRRNIGLNENLARELIELHSLGVGGRYTQSDVRDLALALTGLSVSPEQGFVYRAGLAEPGPVQVLGHEITVRGPDRARQIAKILAHHPDTGRHLAQKLAVHFVGPDGADGLANALAQRFARSDGDLGAVVESLLAHPLAKAPLGAKMRTPFEFMVASARALGLEPSRLDDLGPRDMNRALVSPLTRMGQAPLRPAGPDGWSEETSHWITPATLAARLNWAASLAEDQAERVSPTQTRQEVLGAAASPALTFAMEGAESRAVALTYLLASPEFNRR